MRHDMLRLTKSARSLLIAAGALRVLKTIAALIPKLLSE
jgi:hypothetical protein